MAQVGRAARQLRFPLDRRQQEGTRRRAWHHRQGCRRRLSRHLHRRSAQCDPACDGERSRPGPQPSGNASRARCASVGRTVPLQLAAGRGSSEARGLIPPSGPVALARAWGDQSPHALFHAERRTIMSLKEFADTLPDYAKDIRLNISSLLNDQMLGDQRKYGLLLACAHGTGYQPIVQATEREVEEKLSDAAKNAARAAAAVMAMNNVYYRFVHLASNQEYAKMPAKLRMNVIGSPGIDKADFELFSLAVSAMNGCGACIDSHEKVLRDHNVNADIIQTAARVGAVMAAVAKVHATAV